MRPAEKQIKPESFAGLTLVGCFPSRHACQEYVSERAFEHECMVQNGTMLFEIRLALEKDEMPERGQYHGLRRGQEARARARLALVLRTLLQAGAQGICQMKLWWPSGKDAILDRSCLTAIAARQDPGERNHQARLLLTILRLLEEGDELPEEPWMDTGTARQLLEV